MMLNHLSDIIFLIYAKLYFVEIDSKKNQKEYNENMLYMCLMQ